MLEEMDADHWAEWIAAYKIWREPPKPASNWKQQQHAMMMHAKITGNLKKQKGKRGNRIPV